MLLSELVEYNGETAFVNARKLFKWLEYSRTNDFQRWIKRYLLKPKYAFKENVDYSNSRQMVSIENTNIKQDREEYYLTLDTAKEMAMLSSVPKGKETRDYFIQCEKELEEIKIKNIKAITMIFSHRDKLSLTYSSLYPILNELGVLNVKRSLVHNAIKKALIGKYENIKMDKAFNESDFINDYKLLAEQMKEKYTGYFVDDNQFNWFDCLELDD